MIFSAPANKMSLEKTSHKMDDDAARAPVASHRDGGSPAEVSGGPTVPGPRGSREVSLSVGAFAKLDDSGVSKWLHNHAAKFGLNSKTVSLLCDEELDGETLLSLTDVQLERVLQKIGRVKKVRRALASLPGSGGDLAPRPVDRKLSPTGRSALGRTDSAVDRRDKGVFESSMSSLPSLRSGFSDTTDANLRALTSKWPASKLQHKPMNANKCPNRCGWCPPHDSNVMLAVAISRHVSSECPLATVQCLYKKLGCLFHGKRVDMPEHMASQGALHSELLLEQLTATQSQVTRLRQTVKDIRVHIGRDLRDIRKLIHTKLRGVRDAVERRLARAHPAATTTATDQTDAQRSDVAIIDSTPQKSKAIEKTRGSQERAATKTQPPHAATFLRTDPSKGAQSERIPRGEHKSISDENTHTNTTKTSNSTTAYANAGRAETGTKAMEPPTKGAGPFPEPVDFSAGLAMDPGSFVDCRDTVGMWLAAQVIAESEGKVRIHYLKWDSNWDEWIDMKREGFRFGPYQRFSSRLPPDKPKPHSFRVGDAVWVCPAERTRVWRKGSVTKTKGSHLKVKYAFRGETISNWFHYGSGEIRHEAEANAKSVRHASARKSSTDVPPPPPPPPERENM